MDIYIYILLAIFLALQFQIIVQLKVLVHS